MMRFAAALASALLLLAAKEGSAAPAAGPLGIDAGQPIAVNADSFLADLKSETGTYTGNVIVTQGPIRLQADRLKVSAPGGKASRMEVEGHVVVDSPSGQAVGDLGVYDVVAQVLRLTGNVVLTKDSNVMRGSALEVSMASGVAHLTAGPEGSTPGAPPGRVQGLFLPRQGTNPAVPPATGSGNPPNP